MSSKKPPDGPKGKSGKDDKKTPDLMRPPSGPPPSASAKASAKTEVRSTSSSVLRDALAKQDDEKAKYPKMGPIKGASQKEKKEMQKVVGATARTINLTIKGASTFAKPASAADSRPPSAKPAGGGHSSAAAAAQASSSSAGAQRPPVPPIPGDAGAQRPPASAARASTLTDGDREHIAQLN